MTVAIKAKHASCYFSFFLKQKYTNTICVIFTDLSPFGISRYCNDWNRRHFQSNDIKLDATWTWVYCVAGGDLYQGYI